MADESEDRRCAACGGPVGPGGRTLTPLPPRVAPQVKAPPSPTQQIEDAKDDITPVQRFERAIQRRDAATPQRPSRRGKKDDTAG